LAAAAIKRAKRKPLALAFVLSRFGPGGGALSLFGVARCLVFRSHVQTRAPPSF